MKVEGWLWPIPSGAPILLSVFPQDGPSFPEMGIVGKSSAWHRFSSLLVLWKHPLVNKQGGGSCLLVLWTGFFESLLEAASRKFALRLLVDLR